VTVRLAGLGAVTGYGWGTGALEDGLRSGRSALAVGEVDGFSAVAAVVPHRGRESIDHDERYGAAVTAAVDEALAEATANGWQPGAVVGVIFCTGIADIRTVRDNFFSGTRPLPSLFPRMLHTSTGSLLAQHHLWTGPNLVLNAACSSGNVALATAELWMRSGLATDVVVVGAEFCLIDEIITGFRRMRVLPGAGRPAEDCRPFQEGSRGFFLGEAAIAVVVTGRADGGRATFLGGATTHDAFHPVAAEPEGRELERCLREALAAAGTAPAEVGLVKAHGSGTPLNDGVEAALADRLFPETTRLCSYKPLVGHCMGASALVELAALLAGHRVGRLPRHVTGDPAHPRLADGDPVPEGPVVAASVGLGGANAAVVLDITDETTPTIADETTPDTPRTSPRTTTRP
jgi:3-oxoacyl-[acyl-carrier-protein] synthase II